MTLIYFLLILGVTIFIHELGHFIFAKRAGIYVYEFAIGMGPKLYSFKRKNDETSYSIRLIPLGGYVQLAGEEVEEDKDIPKEKRAQSKTWWQRFVYIVAGATFNFLLAIVILFIMGLIYGAQETRPIIGKVYEDYPAYASGIREGDTIVSINGEKMSTWDDVLMKFQLAKGATLTFKLKNSDGELKETTVKPAKEETEDATNYKYGVSPTMAKNYGLVASIKYTVIKFGATIKSMFLVVGGLITGHIGLNNLAGPVGIYNLVGEGAASGFSNILYLLAFLSVNVGFVNLLPFPAFDGGRVLFLIIEKIKGSKINPRTENIIHAIGFALLMLLMLIITIQDIRKLF